MHISDIPEFIQERETYSLPSNSTMKEVVRLMAERSIGAIPVVDGGKIVGVFSERDIMKRVVAKNLDLESTKLSDVMTRDPKCVEATTEISEAINIMVFGKFRHLPVTDENGKLLAFLSQRDFMAFSWMKLQSVKHLIAD